MKNSSFETVVLIHGLWMTGHEMILLEKRLQKEGFATRRFSYKSMADDLDTSAEELFEFVSGLDEKQIHFVCHSLGGLVCIRMLNSHQGERRGRAVLLGSPLGGSRTAQKLRDIGIGPIIVGRKLDNLCKGSGNLPKEYEIGVMGGTLNLGTGLLFGGWKYPGDGLVALDEIEAPGVKEVCHVHANHIGLVFSAVAARQISSFLKTGSFRKNIKS